MKKNVSVINEITRKASFIFFCLLLNFSSSAGIRTVQVIEGDDTPDNLYENASRELTVHNSRIDGFRLPFISGKSHRVHIKGFTIDLCDKVQICRGNGGSIIRTISGSQLIKYNPGGHANEGNLEFDIIPSDLPGVDE